MQYCGEVLLKFPLQRLLTFGNSANFLNLHFIHPGKEAKCLYETLLCKMYERKFY